MRLLIGFLVLLGTFTLALLWQRRTTRAPELGALSSTETRSVARAYATDWGRIVLGAPSGADPIEVEVTRLDRSPAMPPTSAPDRSTSEPQGSQREFQLTVQRGQTLSHICQGHYNTARREIVDAVAIHNQLRSASELREGQVLRLPTLDALLSRR